MRPIGEQVVLVTGATDGIGEELARRLVAEGSRVIVHGRSVERAKAAQERVGAADAGAADLASFAQVRALAAAVGRRYERIDALVNNAGIGFGTAPPRGARTQDGHGPTWQVNFLSAFLLTLLLRDQLAAGDGGRVLNVSSGVHAGGEVDLEQPDTPRARARTGNRRSRSSCSRGSWVERWRELGVDVNACSPGWIATKMGGAGGGELAEGADTPLWLVTDPGLDGVTGRYFASRQEQRPNPQVEDTGDRRRLWESAAAATGGVA